MITFLCIPRAFVGEFDDLQRMAIRSWREAVPDCQVLMFGNEAGMAEAAQELGVTHCDELHYGINGAPLADRPFSLGEHYAIHDWMLFASADIVFGADLLPALHAVEGIERPFVIGQRWDIPQGASAAAARLHPPCGVDYFMYRRGTIGPVLPFTVRGGGGDNWKVWKALTAWQMTVIDATADITAIHVNHAHPEWPSGKAGRQGSAEQAENRRLYREDGMPRLYGVNDAPWVLRNGHLLRREEANA